MPLDRQKLTAAINNALSEVDERVDECVNAIRRNQPSDSGTTRAKWGVRRRQRGERVTWEIFNPTKSNGYYIWRLLHEGTGIYGPSHSRIEPVSAQALRFRPSRGGGGGGRRGGSRGGWVYAAWTRGMRPSDYLERAVESSFGNFGRVRTLSRPGSRVP